MKKIYFIGILLISAFILKSCVPIPHQIAGQSDQDYANSICSSPDNIKIGAVFPTALRFTLSEKMPSCNVLQMGAKYTTDGSNPKTSNTAKTIYIDQSQVFEIYVQYNNGKIFDYNNSISDVISSKKGFIVDYKTPANAFVIQQTTELYVNPTSQLNEAVIAGGFLSEVFPKETSYKVVGFLRNVKNDDIWYTEIIDVGNSTPTENLFNAPKTTKVFELKTENTSDSQKIIINGMIENKKEFNGFLHSTNTQAYNNYINNGTLNLQDWEKVVVNTNKLIKDEFKRDSYSESTGVLQDNREHYFIGFTSSDANLVREQTLYSAALKVVINTNLPSVSVTQTGTNNSITAKVTADNAGNTAITNYGFDLYEDLDQTPVKKNFTEPLLSGQSASYTFNNLNPNSIYYVAGYAENTAGKVYDKNGPQTVFTQSFMLPVQLTVDKPTITDFDWIAEFKGKITEVGTNAIADYGFIYNRPANDELNLPAKTLVFGSSDVEGNQDDFNISKDSVSVFQGTHIVKAFAKTKTGSFYYSDSKSFEIIGLATVTMDEPVINGNNISLTGHVTNDGGAPITNFTFSYFGSVDSATLDPSLVTGNPSNFQGTFTNLEPGVYQFSATVTNSAGTSSSYPFQIIID